MTREADGSWPSMARARRSSGCWRCARFPGDALYSQLAERGELTRSRIDELAETIVRFPRQCRASRGEEGGWPGMNEVVEGNAQDLARLAGRVLPREEVAEVDAASRAQLAASASFSNRVADDGKVRHCHGDLHLRNIVLLDDRPVLFDCIEFNESFACIDVLYDLAFLIMDLVERGLDGAGVDASAGLCRAQ